MSKLPAGGRHLAIRCTEHGDLDTDDVFLLTWDSPHGEESCGHCGGDVEFIDNPDWKEEQR